jgi:hypothetical protein
MAHDVFISHSSKDKATADAVCAMLESHGIRCWIAPRDVLASMEYGEAIIDAIEECRIMVLVFTAHANESPQIRREIERAVNHGIAILPLRMEDVLPGKSLEYFIGNVHWLDALTPPFEAHLKNLAGTVKIVLARTEPGAPPVPPQEEIPAASAGHRAGEATPEIAGGRQTAPAPRPFWSAGAWILAAGAVAALLLGAVFIGMHLNSHPAPVASPEPAAPPAQAVAPNPAPTPPSASVPKAANPSGAAGTVPPPARPISPSPAPSPSPEATAGSAPALGDTMKTLQNQLSGIRTVSFTAVGQNVLGRTIRYDFVEEFSNVVANPAQCRVSYHWREWQNGTANQDKDSWFLLHNVTSVVVEPESQYLNDDPRAIGGNNGLNYAPTTPPVATLNVRVAETGFGFPFTDAALAHRTAATLRQAVILCGGYLTN